MDDIAIISKNDLTSGAVFRQFQSYFGEKFVYFDQQFKTDIWIDKEGNTIYFQPSNGDQDMSDYEPGELPSVSFKPYLSIFTYHSFVFAAEVIEALLPVLGEGSLVDDEFGHIVSAEAFIFKHSGKQQK
jgi:hypothetical protein